MRVTAWSRCASGVAWAPREYLRGCNVGAGLVPARCGFQKTGRHKAYPYRKGIPMVAVMDKKEIVKGGSFLIEERTPAEIFTPEDFNEEHRMIAETTRQFMDAEVLPRINELEAKDWKLARELVKQAADLGLVGANIPEEY